MLQGRSFYRIQDILFPNGLHIDVFSKNLIQSFPGQIEDLVYDLMNNHILLSTFCAEIDSPVSRLKRIFCFSLAGVSIYTILLNDFIKGMKFKQIYIFQI